jgi:hypothetical protein
MPSDGARSQRRETRSPGPEGVVPQAWFPSSFFGYWRAGRRSGDHRSTTMAENEHTPEHPRDEPEQDLKEEPSEQRTGEDPEDLLRRTEQEKAERDRRLADDS